MTLRLTHGALPILPLLLVNMLTTSVASADGQSGPCSNKTIKGEYGFSYSGQILAAGPIAGVAMFSFDGHGNLSLLDHTLINGAPQSTSWRFSTGTYTVNENCTGSFVITFTDGFTPPLHASMLVLERGREIRDVVTDEGTAITAVGVRRDSPR
jgi:hypothetical protein